MSWPEGFWVRHGQDGTLTVARAEPVPPRSEKRALRLLPEEGQFIWYGRSVTVQKGLFDGRWRPGWQAIDADRWPRLAVRGWEQGDRVHPLGMQGHSKKLQDIFVDKKIPRAERQAALVIVPANRPETILAVVGVVTDECARARPGEGVYWLRADETQWHGRG
jgi:tRNA(Ile)-lysidine synthetase-like protein